MSTETRSNQRWPTFLAVLCGAVFLLTLALAEPSKNIAYNAGTYMPLAMIVAAISYAVFGRGGGIFVGAVILASVYASFLLASTIAIQFDRPTDRDTVNYVVDMMEELLDESGRTNPDGTSRPIEKTFVPSPSATGSDAVTQQFVANIANRTAENSNEFFVELESIGFISLLDPARLDRDENLIESREILVATRSAIDNHYIRIGEIIEEFGRKIDYLAMSESKKQSLRNGFIGSIGTSIDKREQMRALDEEVVNQYEKIIDLLDESPRSWFVNSDQILFDTNTQADEFNDLMEKIDSLTAEQVQLQNDAVERQRNEVDAKFPY